jgi:hypothetical protein
VNTDRLVEALEVTLTKPPHATGHEATIREAIDALRNGAALLGPADLFGPAQAAAFLGVNRTTVSRWKREGVMPTPFQDLGEAGTWTLWTRASLEAFKAQRDADAAALRRPVAAAAE